MKKQLLQFLIIISFAGCVNTPKQSVEIIKYYEKFDCPALAIELDSLNKIENELVISQKQKVTTTQIQVFWWGFNQDSNIENIELSNLRTKKEALKSLIKGKTCKINSVDLY